MEPQTPQNNPTNDTSCVICFEQISLDHKAVIKNCAHVFCFICIKSWMQNTITCPLCKQTIDILQHSFTSETTFQEEKVEGKKEGGEGGDSSGGTNNHMTDQDQLQCLDHSFFITEVQRLLHNAETRHRQLWQEGKTARGLSVWSQQQLEVVESVTSELRNHKRHLNALLHFDPHQTLQDLYRLQDLLQTSWSQVPASLMYAHSPPTRYSADDAVEGDFSDDEDFADDMAYMKISKGNGGGAAGGKKKKGGATRQSKSKYRTSAEKIGSTKNRKNIAN